MVNISARISRSLVTVIFLSFIQVVAGPILAPQISTPVAQATTPGIDATNLALDVNAADATDMSATNMNYGGSPSPAFTSTGGGYYSLAPGNTQYLVPKAGVTLNANNHISVFMWVYPRGEGQLLTQLGTQVINDNYHTAIIDYSSTDQMHFGLWRDVGDQGSVNGSSTIATPKNNWYYVGLVYDGTKVTAYINGVQAGQSPNFNYAAPATSYFGIGAYDITTINQGASYGNMRFGALHVYKSALTGTQVANNFAATTGRFGPTVSNPSSVSTFINRTATFTSSTCTNATSGSATCFYQWQLSTDSGTTWSFLTGETSTIYTTPLLTSANNGYRYRLYAWDPGTGTTTANDLYTITSVATLTVATPPGSDTDTALSLSGSSQYAEASDSTGSPFDLTGAVTIQAWVRPTSSCSGDQAVIAKFDSYMMYCGGGLWKYVYDADGASWVGANTTIAVQPNEWHHIAYAKSAAGQLLVYVDGQLVQTISTTGAMTPNNGAFQIGRYGTANLFQGQIDEVRVFKTQRSAAQIASDMHSYSSITEANLIAYYDFNEGITPTIYNRISGATSATDLTITGSVLWTDVKIVDSVSQPAYTSVQFLRTYITSTGGWRTPTDVRQLQYLVVAGGGAGGGSMYASHYAGGGGGAGGVRTAVVALNSTYLSPKVGMGQFALGCVSGRGDSSTLSGSGFTTVSTTGGGSGSCNASTADGAGGIAGNSGGSGGGGGAQVPLLSPGSGNLGGFSPAEGSTGGAARADGADGNRQAGGGGGGATQVGFAATAGSSGVATAGNGGAGLLSTILDGTNRYYGGGGGGGVRATATVGSGGLGGGGNGGSTDANQGTAGTAGTGGGGGGNSKVIGNSGGSGVIIVRWIKALKPIFTQPTNDTTTAGITDTITVSANPISPLTRNYRWQVSTDTGTTWANASTGSGITSNTYTTPILDTSTSGSRYQYRVIVTDSDTVGLSIVDTSVAVFIVVNPPIVFSGTYTSQKYGDLDSDTFTVTNGTGNKTFTYTPGNRTGITWSSPSANTAVVTVARTVAVGTYPETITATDTRGAQTQLLVSVVVTKADTITVTTLARSDTYTGSALTFTPTFTVAGLKNSDTVTPISWEYAGADNAGTTYSTSTTRPMNAGSYTITPVTPISLLDSYTAVRQETATLTINRATRTIAMTAPASPLKYGDTRTAVATPSAGTGDGTISYQTSTSDSCTVSSTTIRAVRSAGTCSFTAMIARGNNFETATSTAVTTTLTKADTITVQMRNPVTLTYTASPAVSLPILTIVGLVHTDTATATRLYSHPASVVGAPESYAALINSATIPTDVESYTVSSSALSFSSGVESNYVNVVRETSTLIINQANQAPLRIAMYGASVGSPYTITTDGGSGGGVVTETTTAGSTASNCAITSRILTMTSTVSSYCNILVTKVATRNFKVESATAQITFFLFIPTVSAPAGGGPGIGIGGINTVTVDAVGAPTITSLSATTISLSAGGSLTISGTGFGSTSLTVKFWRDKSVTITPSYGSTIVVPVADIAAADGQSGRITVITLGGTAVSVERLTINP
jgi:hypothetical protein